MEGLRLGSSERLGIDGLLTLVNALPATEPETHIDQLIAAVNTHNAHRHTDDVALLRLDWSTPATLGDGRLSDTQPHEAITT